MTVTEAKPTRPTRSGSTGMRVRKRNGEPEPVDVNKIVRAVQRCADDLDEVDPLRVGTAWELPQRALIDLAAARGPFVDQSQSLNLFMAAPTIGRLSSMYLHAWKSGLKTTYYLRSRPATRIQQATVAVAATSATAAGAAENAAVAAADAAALACSLENPETCEACQ